MSAETFKVTVPTVYVIKADGEITPPPSVNWERCARCGFGPIACSCDHSISTHTCEYTSGGKRCQVVLPTFRNLCYAHMTELERRDATKDRKTKPAVFPGHFYGRLRSDACWHDFACMCWLCDPPVTITPVVEPSYEDKIYFASEEVLGINESDSDGILDYSRRWVSMENLRRMKQGMALENIHFKIQTGGSRDAVDVFHYILSQIDKDYPLDPFRKASGNLPFCTRCHGLLWRKANVQPEQLKRLGKQCGIRVKISRYVEERKCGSTTYVHQQAGATGV